MAFETDHGKLRAIIERFLTIRTNKKRLTELLQRRAKADRDAELAEIQCRLDDVAGIMQRPIDDPLVLAVTAASLRRPGDQDDEDEEYPKFEW